MTDKLSVRKMAPTTVSLAALFVAWHYLAPWIWHLVPGALIRQVPWRFHGAGLIHGVHWIIIVAAFWVVLAAATMDAALRQRVALAVLASYMPLIMPTLVTGIVARALPVSVSQYLFWGLVYVAAILGVFWVSRKLGTICHEHQGLGQFLKSIPQFGGYSSAHMADRVLTACAAVALLAFDLVLVVSLAVFVVVNRGVLL